ncbi:MAG TPA: DsbC family protein [Mariprofundaceae bacterium]|nr:DsbC family protein [Mariprofundaceae bacterium]
MIRHTAWLLLALVLLTAPSCFAGPVDRNSRNEAQIEKTIRANIPDLKIDAIRPFKPIPGLYEIRSGSNIFYTDSSGHHLLSGHIFSTRDHRDLTEARLEEINRINWKVLPLKDAIVSGDPNGTPVAIFTDPKCPYCRKLETQLPKLKGVKVYTFLYPLERIHPGSHATAEAIWCAKDRHKALLDVMLKHGKLPKAQCTTPIDRNLKLGHQLGIGGTPTLIAHDGRKHAGYLPANKLRTWLARAPSSDK